jgi:hypothetical protein
MTKKALKTMYCDFFKSEGLEYKWVSYTPAYITVMYEGNNYRVQLDTKRNKGGRCFHVFVFGPEFPQFGAGLASGFSVWDDEELHQHVLSAANTVNRRARLGRVLPDSAVIYLVEIELQSPDQFARYFYQAVHALRDIERDFLSELRDMGVEITIK